MKLQIPALSVAQWVAAALLITIALVGVASLAWNFDPFGRRQHAEQKAATATVQAEVNAATAEVTADVAEDTGHIHRKAQEVRDALDASTDMDGDLAIWSSGIDRVLDGSERPSDQSERKPDNPGA